MQELRNKCIELSNIVFNEIESLPETEQDKIYNMDKSVHLSEKDGSIYILSFLYECLNESLQHLNKLLEEEKES